MWTIEIATFVGNLNLCPPPMGQLFKRHERAGYSYNDAENC